jgi:hypothetical protein
MGDVHSFIAGSRRCGRRFLDAAIPLLEQQRAEAETDLYEPVVSEVLGGLLARVFRFLQTFVLDYHLWAEDLGAVVLRMMRESVFYMRFLAQQAEPATFLEFQRYGMGQLKLYKLQLRKLLEEGRITDSVDLRSFIDSDCDEEVSDLLLEVRLKNFEDLRKLSEAAGSKEEYVLHYQPESIIVHGHWPALREFYLEACQEPLHRWHLQPRFRLPNLDPSLLGQAVDLFATAYGIWIKKNSVPDIMEPLIDRYLEEIEALANAEPVPMDPSP